MSDDVSDVTCAQCMFWARPRDIDQTHGKLPTGWGECRRYAPRGMSINMTTNSEKVVTAFYNFAPMPPTDWCGEFVRAISVEDEAP